MNEEILNKLHAVTDNEWRIVISKCHTHVGLKLAGKTDYGAHCERRLGMKAEDYYVVNAINALYEGRWTWKYEKYNLEEQLIRVINSMISKQVEKYRNERGLIQTIAMEPQQMMLLPTEVEADDEPSLEDMERFTKALEKTVAGNTTYIEFIRLKKEGYTYDDICKFMKCSRQEAYRINETIARKAKQLLN